MPLHSVKDGRRLPSAIIIGAQRAGTTSLFNYLSLHPQVTGSSKKETEYFTMNWHKGLSWYADHFPAHSKLSTDSITLEASPSYHISAQAPKRMKEQLEHTRIIFLVRNPSIRAMSHYYQEVAAQVETRTMQEAFEQEEDSIKTYLAEIERNDDAFPQGLNDFSYLYRGRYYEQLQTFRKHFEENQILMVKSEDLFDTPDKQLSRIHSFLDIEINIPDKIERFGTIRKNVADQEEEKKHRPFLDDCFSQQNEMLRACTGISWD